MYQNAVNLCTGLCEIFLVKVLVYDRTKKVAEACDMLMLLFCHV